MTIHAEVLRAAQRICRERQVCTFTPDEVVRALPQLNESSVRTHVVSRCCVNAPKNHPHKWHYFRRVRRGVYEIEPAFRQERESGSLEAVAETAATYRDLPVRDSVHAFIFQGKTAYSAECLEVAVVSQGSTLDETVYNLREALTLHLEGEDMEALGLKANPQLVISFESSLDIVPAAQATVG